MFVLDAAWLVTLPGRVELRNWSRLPFVKGQGRHFIKIVKVIFVIIKAALRPHLSDKQTFWVHPFAMRKELEDTVFMTRLSHKKYVQFLNLWYKWYTEEFMTKCTASSRELKANSLWWWFWLIRLGFGSSSDCLLLEKHEAPAAGLLFLRWNRHCLVGI